MYPTPLNQRKKRRRSHKRPLIISALLVIAASAYAGITINQPFAQLQPTVASTNLRVTTPAPTLPWPAYGQGAFGLADGTVVASYGEQTPVPIASVSKVILALSVLDKYPLAAGTSGPTITMTAADVASYNNYIAMRGSVMGISQGQRLTLKQMLQGIMLPSANNIADSLAIWGFGSISAYHDYANKYLAKNGMTATKVGGDASGYSNESVSTARDLVKLGSLATQNTALADIVRQKSATIPGTGVITNYNNLLGNSNVTGIKTGNNDGNGGVFLGSATVRVNGRDVTVISALSGAPSLSRVLRDSGIVLSTAQSQFTVKNIVKKDAVLATYRQADGTLVQAVATKDLDITALGGTTVSPKVTAKAIGYDEPVGTTVGSVSMPATAFSPAQSVPITLKQQATKPTIMYRLLHP